VLRHGVGGEVSVLKMKVKSLISILIINLASAAPGAVISHK